MPTAIYKALVVLAILGGWRRWAAVTLLAFKGCSRPGEPLRADRSDLLLPSDMQLDDVDSLFVKVMKPKSGRRGKGLVQHFKVAHSGVVKFCENVFKDVKPGERLYPATPGTYRRRWDKLLKLLEVPKDVRLTPGGLRGGGAVAAYKSGRPLVEILWQMRIKHLVTLESYLQEVAADSILPKLSAKSRELIKDNAELSDTVLHL